MGVGEQGRPEVAGIAESSGVLDAVTALDPAVRAGEAAAAAAVAAERNVPSLSCSRRRWDCSTMAAAAATTSISPDSRWTVFRSPSTRVRSCAMLAPNRWNVPEM